MLEAALPHPGAPSAENGVAASRQEAFCADRHFFNASNDPFEAIIAQFSSTVYCGAEANHKGKLLLAVNVSVSAVSPFSPL